MAHAQGLLDGIYTGIVSNNHDPLNMGRLKVTFPWTSDQMESHWCRLVQPYAGNERGMFFMPEVGDEVLVVFEMGDFNQPLVVGGTWNGEDPPPEPGDPDGSNHHKIIETRSGHTLVFGDEPGEEFIQLKDSSLQNIVRWDSKTDHISITAQTGDIIIRAPQGSINLLAKDVRFSATDSSTRTVGGNETITVEQSATEIQSNSRTLSANTSLTGSAKTFTFEASSSISASGGSAEVKVDGQTGNDRFSISGSTTDTATSLNIEAEVFSEQVESRTWNVAGTANFIAGALSFDASGNFSLNGGNLTINSSGYFALLGDKLAMKGSMITFAECGMINLNPTSETPPQPAVSGQFIAQTAAGAIPK
ncbi:MAG: phage baseplate assembly protein V [Bradymonadia bacterium]